MVAAVTVDAGFQPVTVSITLESKEELQAFKALMWHRDSVPKFLTESKGTLPPSLREPLSCIMDATYHAFPKIGE